MPDRESEVYRIRARSANVSTLVPALKVFLARAFSPDGPPRLEAVAREARCSVRTIQRRLRDAGLTYSRVLDDVRLETAAQLLRESGLRVVDVAVDLGYSDQANFTRAFRRWAGVSPTQFRAAIPEGLSGGGASRSRGVTFSRSSIAPHGSVPAVGGREPMAVTSQDCASRAHLFEGTFTTVRPESGP